jgi:alpha-beta hydrolase superfamily lysophospholipase
MVIKHVHTVFGVEREIEIPAAVFPTPDEFENLEQSFTGCEHGWFDSCHEGAKLHYRKWLPKNNKKPKAIVVFMHGIAAHTGIGYKLENGRKIGITLLADDFQKEDYAFYCFDMYGHGYSEGTRFWIPNKWQTNMEDYIKFANLAASFHDNDIPLFLMGESYGGTLTIHVAKAFQENPELGPKNFDSIILTAPAIIGDLPPYPVYLILRYILAPYFPKWRPFFMPNVISPERIWKDPEVLAHHTDKRYVEMGVDGSGIPFRLGTALGLVVALEDSRTTAIPGFTVPYCIVHGTKDYGVPIAGSEFMWNTTETPQEDRAFHRQEGAYHDLMGDPTAEDTVQFIIDWTKKRIAAKK